MRSFIIFLAFISFWSSNSNATTVSINTNYNPFYNYNNAVYFVENGVEFYVFINGEFDFNIINNRFDRRDFRNQRYFISRDRFGTIYSIGNIIIDYDRRGNVTRIGDVFLRYHRDRLIRVGNLRVNYNRWGYPVFYGSVNVFNNRNFNLGFNIYFYDDPFFYRDNFDSRYERYNEDNDFYYYRPKSRGNNFSDDDIIKRRKENVGRRTLPATNRNSDFNYRKNTENKDVEIDTNRRINGNENYIRNEDKNKDEERSKKNIKKRRS